MVELHDGMNGRSTGRVPVKSFIGLMVAVCPLPDCGGGSFSIGLMGTVGMSLHQIDSGDVPLSD